MVYSACSILGRQFFVIRISRDASLEGRGGTRFHKILCGFWKWCCSYLSWVGLRTVRIGAFVETLTTSLSPLHAPTFDVCPFSPSVQINWRFSRMAWSRHFVLPGKYHLYLELLWCISFLEFDIRKITSLSNLDYCGRIEFTQQRLSLYLRETELSDNTSGDCKEVLKGRIRKKPVP